MHKDFMLKKINKLTLLLKYREAIGKQCQGMKGSKKAGGMET